jgi:hypothetical protein
MRLQISLPSKSGRAEVTLERFDLLVDDLDVFAEVRLPAEPLLAVLTLEVPLLVVDTFNVAFLEGKNKNIK